MVSKYVNLDYPVLNTCEVAWLRKCKMYSDKYKLVVEHDCVFVRNTRENKDEFVFTCSGQDLLIKILKSYCGTTKVEVIE